MENASSDRTIEEVMAFAREYSDIDVTLLVHESASMVTARIAGVSHFQTRQVPPRVFVSMDADTTLPPGWIAAAATLLNDGAQLVASDGGFGKDLCPLLRSRYLDEIGTIFFDPQTRRELADEVDSVMFSPELFRDWGRFISDCAFAMSWESFMRVGGFQQLRYRHMDAEIAAVGWPVEFQAHVVDMTSACIDDMAYVTSPRRLIGDAVGLFDAS